MNILQRPQAPPTEPRQRFVIHGVNWRGYSLILEVLGDSHIRVTYDRGSLELMSPSTPHEVYRYLFGRLLDVLMEELDLPFKAIGSTTLRREGAARGLEPDQCFYLASAARVRSWRDLDLTVDPPPDLAIEIEISRSVLDRIGVYAALGIPELWRCDGETVRAYRLREDGTYEECAQSPALPFVPLAEVIPLLEQSMDVADDRVMLRSLRAWVRERVLPLREAHREGGGEIS